MSICMCSKRKVRSLRAEKADEGVKYPQTMFTRKVCLMPSKDAQNDANSEWRMQNKMRYKKIKRLVSLAIIISSRFIIITVSLLPEYHKVLVFVPIACGSAKSIPTAQYLVSVPSPHIQVL